MDQSNTNGFYLHFEPPKTSSPSLQQQVQQLIKQKGALRRISSKTVQAEIDQPLPDTSSTENGDNAENDSDHETSQARQERIWKAREEILQKLAYAQNEILSALDFVSLLLSGTSTVAQNSMSPALKERVPTGSIEWKSIERQQISLPNKQRLTQVSEGWKSQSFKSASEKFGQAASRLATEAQRQSNYWDQVAGLKAKGWSISRLPSDSRAIGIHYGFPESASQFRNRSFALLQQDDLGNLKLDSRSIPEDHTTTRVVVIRNGIETGISRVDLTHSQHEDNIERQVSQARDAIFEEELFHELSREARLIANQGARTQPEAVEIRIDSRSSVRIIQMSSEKGQFTPSSGPDDQFAEAIALSLRLLLLLEHAKSKQRRSQPPSSMSLASQTIAEYALLRPILANMRHRASLTELYYISNSLQKTFAKADLPFEFKLTGKSKFQRSDDMQELRQPVRSTLVVRAFGGQSIEMEIETYLGSPIYGTIFRSKKLSFEFLELSASSFNTIEEASEYLTHALTLELISHIPEFDVLKPFSGEVVLKGAKKVTATVNIHPQRLSLLVTNAEKIVYNWRPNGFQRMPPTAEETAKSFREIVVSLNQKP